MRVLRELFRKLDRAFIDWMARHGVTLLRISLGIVFLWFGALKFFPGLSPAEGLAAATIERMTAGLIPARTAVYILAVWESLIGLGLLFGLYLRATLALLWLQMLGTITPVFLFPAMVFRSFPLVPTLEGQYIFKNFVLISAGLVIGATVRGGAIVSQPREGDK